MQGPNGHRARLGAAVALFFSLALTWGLLRFGAAETSRLYQLFLFLLLPAVLALVTPPWRGRVDSRSVVLVLLGVFLLSLAAFNPTLEARGYLHLAVGWIALWLSLWLAVRSRRQQRFLLLLLILLGALEALYGLVQSIGGVDYIGSYFRNRGRIATGTLINRNHYAALLNMILPLGLGMLATSVAGRRRDDQPRSETLARTWIVLLGSSLMGVAVLLSLSRGGTLSLLLTLLFLGMLLVLGRRRLSRRRLSGAAIAVLVFTIAGMGAAIGVEALLERFGHLEQGLSRVAVYRDSLELIRDHPGRGVGPGMYRWRFHPYQSVSPGSLYGHAHNDYLETSAECGVLLALLGWAFVFWRFFRASEIALKSRDPRRQGLALGCAAAMFSILIHSLIDFSLQIPAILMVFACIVALAWSLEFDPAPHSGRREREWAFGTWWTDLALRGLLLVALTATGWQVWGRSRAAEMARPEHGVSGLEQAVRLDPKAPDLRFLLGMAYRDLPGAGDLETAATELEAAVRLNPYAWRYRLEMARTEELQGRIDDARESLQTAVDLSPFSALYRWRLGNFELRHGSVGAAVEEVSHAVRLDPLLAEPAVAVLLKSGASVRQIEALLPADRGALLRLLRLVSRLETSRGLAPVLWQRLLTHPEPLNLAEGRSYIDQLFREGRISEAHQRWLELVRLEGLEDPDFTEGHNKVWNGGFEQALAGTPFGWNLRRSEAYSARRVQGLGADGSWALEFDFRGTENLSFTHVSQELLLEAGTSYRLSFEIRTEEISTEEGVYLELLSRDPSERLFESEPFRGTNDWTPIEAQFTMPEGNGQALLRLGRRHSRQIDNKISGRVWIDLVTVETMEP